MSTLKYQILGDFPSPSLKELSPCETKLIVPPGFGRLPNSKYSVHDVFTLVTMRNVRRIIQTPFLVWMGTKEMYGSSVLKVSPSNYWTTEYSKDTKASILGFARTDKYHRLRASRRRMYFLTILEAESPRSRCQQGSFPLRTVREQSVLSLYLWPADGHLLPGSSHGPGAHTLLMFLSLS